MRVNATFLRWTGYAREELVGVKRFQELLTAGGRIYHETHYAPLLRMQGHVREIAAEIVCADGRRLPVLLNSVLISDAEGEPQIVRTTVFDATERKLYERELLALRNRERAARELAERLHEQSRGVAHALQQSLLGSTPPFDPRYTVATHYQPGVKSLEVGGDWHDAFSLAADRVGIAVGDVVGRGLQAAIAMGQLRSAVRALAAAGFGPGAIVGHLDAFVEQVVPAQYATLAYAEVDAASGEVAFATAGHMPPVLLRDEPQVFLGGRSTPLGVVAPGLPRTQTTFTLAPGEGFMLYTDGLVERRSEAIDDGIARLLRVIRANPDVRPADLVAELVPEDASGDDDVCLLVFRRN